MKSINGAIVNLNEPTIALVADANSTDKEAWVITADNLIINKCDFSGFIIPNNVDIPTGKPAFIVTDWQTKPSNNDILFFSPDNSCVTIYDATSDANGFVLTENCNQNCIMCPQKIGNKTDDTDLYRLAYETILKIPKDCKWLCFTGGEPTLKWSNLLSLIKLSIATLPLVYIQLLTNGTIFHNSVFAEELAVNSNKRITCGIPLYADNPIDHDNCVRLTGSFYKTIIGMQNLASFNVAIELRNVFMSINAKRLMNWARFVYSNLPFVNRVTLMSLEIIGNAKEQCSTLWIDIKAHWDLLREIAYFFKQVGIDFQFYNFPLCTLPVDLHSFAAISISEWKREYLDKCQFCTIKDMCGGFFTSSKNMLIPAIVPYIGKECP
jgi:His-Xaa-Ser system radical SAM maturase HxsC